MKTGRFYNKYINIAVLFMLGGMIMGIFGAHVFAAGNTIAFSTSSNRMYVNGTYSEIGGGDIRPILENGVVYLPLEAVLDAVGGSYTYDENKQIATITTPRQDIWFTSIKLKTLYQQRDKITKSYVLNKSGAVYMEANQLARLLGTEVYTDEDIVVLSDLGGPDDRAYEAIKSKLYFQRPEQSEIISTLLSKNPENEHPRLIARADDWERVKGFYETDEDVKNWSDRIIKTADTALDTAPYRYEIDSTAGLLYITQYITTRIQALSFAWRLTGDERYAERAYLEMESACEFTNWAPTRWLEMGQINYGMACGYDWIYDWMNDEQRAKIKDGIVRLGLNRFKVSYDEFWTGKTLTSTANFESWWTRIKDNWNPWCNRGAVFAALAIGDEEPELCGYILRSALASLEVARDAYAPDGASVEGIGYGSSAVLYFMETIAALDSALGTDYGYYNAPGYAGFASYMDAMVGPVTAFNYHDSGTNTKIYYGGAFFVANKSRDYALGKSRLVTLRANQTSASILDILWYQPGVYENADISASLDKYFRVAETGSMRSSYDDSAIWFGFHGGGNNVNHAHLDSGTFVLDAMGLNWACDLGTEPLTYEMTRRFDDRWLLYRLSPAGHNTIQVNLNSEYGQMVESFSEITKFESKAGGAYAVLDMTEAYSHVASSMRRGFMLTDSRKRVVIQDEITLKSKSDIWWFMHTPAEIEVSEDGKTAMLTQKGKSLRATIVEPANATFYAMAAEPMEGMPSNVFEAVNKGIQKLALNVPDTASTNIMVELMPIYSDFDLTKEPLEYVALDDWEVSPNIEHIPTADNIFIDGEPLDGFDPEVLGYDIPIVVGNENIPVVSAISDYEVEIIQPETAGESKAYVRVYDEEGVLKNVYSLNFTNKPFTGLPKNSRRLDIKAATASASQNDSSYTAYPEYAYDEDTNTRWSASGKQWLQFELAEPAKVNYVSIAFYSGAVRSTYFDILVSEDGTNWTQLYSGESSGTTEDYESYSIYPTTAKYVRLQCHGNSLVGYDQGWNSITEVALYALD